MKKEKKEGTYTYNQVAFGLMFISVVMLLLATSYNYDRQIKELQKDKEDIATSLEKQEQKYECKIDSLINTIDEIKTTFDSLPIGSPLDTIIINDDYGVRRHPIFGNYQMHSGVDMMDTWHDTVYATASGVVRYASWNYGYGRCIEIEHAFGFTTKYAHLHKLFVKKDENIVKGQPIACMGSTGDVTGQHLHYEISHDGKTIDPMPYINCIPLSDDGIVNAIINVESSNNDSAYNASEDAVGCLQIRQTMVNDVNRILKRQGKDKRYTYLDRWDRYKSIEMFGIYCEYYNLKTAEEIARCWNGGPRGINNPATANYWKKVQDHLDS
jgi:hypothetical protein